MKNPSCPEKYVFDCVKAIYDNVSADDRELFEDTVGYYIMQNCTRRQSISDEFKTYLLSLTFSASSYRLWTLSNSVTFTKSDYDEILKYFKKFPRQREMAQVATNCLIRHKLSDSQVSGLLKMMFPRYEDELCEVAEKSPCENVLLQLMRLSSTFDTTLDEAIASNRNASNTVDKALLEKYKDGSAKALRKIESLISGRHAE